MASYRLTTLAILVVALLCVTPALCGVQQVDDLAQFDQILNDNARVVVLFCAGWAVPCRAVGPKFEKIAAQFASSGFVSIKVDVDSALEITAKSGVANFPTFRLYRGGVKAGEMVFFVDEAKLMDFYTMAA